MKLLLAAVMCLTVLMAACTGSGDATSESEPNVAIALAPSPTGAAATPTYPATETAATASPIPTEGVAATESRGGDYVTSAVDDPDQLELGRGLFVATCASCHGIDGQGTLRGRDLTGIAREQPDRAVHIASVTWGKGTMLGRVETMTAEEIDAVVSYVRLTFVGQD